MNQRFFYFYRDSSIFSVGNKNIFEIKPLRQHWVRDDDQYDAYDLCSHGEILITINDETVADSLSGSFCLSAAALHLMRTIDANYKAGDFYNFLIPCCGHFMVVDENHQDVNIYGCPYGIDLTIMHNDDTVQIKSEKAITAELPIDSYEKIVLAFVLDVEGFYGNPVDKILPNDPADQAAFHLFWQEWKRRKTTLIADD